MTAPSESLDHPSLFDGPARDAAFARNAARALPDPKLAQREKALLMEHHQAVRREWVDRARHAMVGLYRERAKAGDAYVSGDELAMWLIHASYEGDKRAMAPVFVLPKGLWTCVGRIKSARRNATLIPAWRLDEAVAAAHGL